MRVDTQRNSSGGTTVFLTEATRKGLLQFCQARFDDPQGDIEWVHGELPDEFELYQTEFDGVVVQFTVDEGINLETGEISNVVDSVSVLY
jgi:hypothetical protein